MKRILALWLAAMLVAVQPCYAVVLVGFGQSATGGITDNFASDSGLWTAAKDGINITGGYAYGTTQYNHAVVIHETTTGSGNHYAQAEVEIASSSGSGLVVGASAASGSATGYLVVLANTTDIKFYTFSGSTISDTSRSWTIGSAISPNTFYTLRVEKNGTIIEVFLEGESLGTKTDSTYTGGQFTGVSINRAAGGNPRLDDFSAGAL